MKPKKSAFDLSHTKAMTAGFDGKLYPILCEPVLPGDVWKGKANILTRVTPLVQPIYGRFDIRTDFFFVPNRLVWDNWTKFISPDENDIQIQPAFPSFYIGEVTELTPVDVVNLNLAYPGKLMDYMGCGLPPATEPSGELSSMSFSALPFRAYAKIWNEFYRDQDLQDEVVIPMTDGYIREDEQHLLQFRYANWEKDYFTTARPWAQKGQPASVPINLTGLERMDNGQTPANGAVVINSGSLRSSAAPNVELQATDAFTIEDLRYANSLQRWLERNARRGTRYIESLKSHFGVRVPDYRLQRPEFIGGGRQPLVISEVLQTNNNPTDDTPLGTYAGHGISSGTHEYSYKADEHGYIIGLMRIVPRTSYMNVVRRDFLKKDRFDFFWPDFAHLGEQEIYKIEVNGRFAFDDRVPESFGYTQRYAEYKFIPSTVHGNFRSDAILANFTPSRNIGADEDEADLNGYFVSMENTSGYERVYAIDSYDPYLVQIYHDITALRPVPRNTNPGGHYL